MRWFYASIDHPGFAPGLQTITLFEAGTPFTYQQDMQIVTELLVNLMTEGLVGSTCEHLPSQDPGQVPVLPDPRKEMLAHVRSPAGKSKMAQTGVLQSP